jgi:hypothetical protein
MESDLFIVTAIGGLAPSLILIAGIALILATFATAFIQALRKRGTRFVENAPTLMTSMGIIGTFMGIVIGLIGFDVTQIDASIPMLLEGLKTAFLTSVVGMIFAVTFKALDACWLADRREPEGAAEGVSPGQILKALNDSNDHLISVRDALAKDSDSSLVGVVQRMRSDLNDRAKDEATDRQTFQTKLFGEMQNFAELLSKSATETVIEALKVVIQDFNKNLTEQFGDNFKRLDESVQKLVTWQQQYMVQLDEMSTQYAEGVKAIDATSVSVKDISERTAEIPAHMSALQDVVVTNQHQIQELQRHLEAFVTMRDKAADAIPAIDKHLNEVGENLSSAANDMKVVMLEGATNFKDSVQQTNTAMQSLASEMQGQSQQVSDTLKDAAVSLESTSRQAMTEVESGISETMSSIKTSLERTTEELNSEINKSINRSLNVSEQQIEEATNKTSESINKQLQALDDAMETELTRVMQEMGSALTKITGQFAEDYTKLVSAMNDIVSQRAA